MKKIYRILGQKGRITLPYALRGKLGLQPDDVLSFRESKDGTSVIVKKEKIFDNPDLLSALSNLGKIGSNLNQIARHLNEGGSMNLSLRNELLQCITELRNIREDVKEMAGEYRGSN